MPCPYFLPLDRLEAGIATRFPLIDAYRGECHAGAVATTPDEASLLSHCNMGYARGRCAQFPPGEGPDAVRFAAGPNGTVRYAREQNHFPYDAGELVAEPDGIFGAQVRAFRASHLRRSNHG